MHPIQTQIPEEPADESRIGPRQKVKPSTILEIRELLFTPNEPTDVEKRRRSRRLRTASQVHPAP